jgi:hypothetical protein
LEPRSPQAPVPQTSRWEGRLVMFIDTISMPTMIVIEIGSPTPKGSRAVQDPRPVTTGDPY